jgi:adenylosuccinate synthase
MQRGPSAALAGQCEKLAERVRIETVALMVHDHLDKGGTLIVEGTQGFGLSLLHGPHYPFVTARDTTASGFAMEVGLSPRQIDRIVLVIRTFPIRVGGNSGPLAHETTWEEVRRFSGAPEVVPELTSVTRRPRRVALFDLEFVKTACRYNRPTSLAVMGIDRLDHANRTIRSSDELTPRARDFLGQLTAATGVTVEWIGTGFATSDALHQPSIQMNANEPAKSL